MSRTSSRHHPPVERYADMFAAMGAEPRLRVLRLLLTAHPDGLVVGELQEELDIPASTLSHHLEKLRHEGLVTQERSGTFLRYRANCEGLQELLAFLFAECCTRSQAIKPETILACCSPSGKEPKSCTSGKKKPQ
ncbi:MAG: ArsR/SmtB family transcription factor [Candidatus Xenobia bacterium]